MSDTIKLTVGCFSCDKQSIILLEAEELQEEILACPYCGELDIEKDATSNGISNE